MMIENHIRVGVRAWDGDHKATNEWGGSIGCMWVEIDGVRVPGQVIRTKTEASAENFQTITIEFAASKVEFVPYDEEALDRWDNGTRGVQ